MTMVLTQTATAISVNAPASFLATGGVAPYTYSILPGGAGGIINSSTGVYTAPVLASSDPKRAYDIIQAIDSNGSISKTRILVGTPLLLVCDILSKGLELSLDRIRIWDQKIFQPTDSGLFIAVSVPMSSPFGNTNTVVSAGDDPNDGMIEIQSANIMDHVDLDIISRDASARDRKAEVLLALNSVYAEQQQELCSFYIGKIPPNSRFINLSQIDGAAIPYRYKISFLMQYFVKITRAVPYYDNFAPVQKDIDSP